MRRVPISLVLVVVIGGLMTILAPRDLFAERPLRGIPLSFRPTTPVGEMGAIDLTDVEDVRIEIGPFGDSREKKDFIGENREDENERDPLPVTTKDDVAAFCAKGLRRVFHEAGLTVVEKGGDAVLAGEVRRFFVAESHLYLGEVTLKLELRGPDGKAVWSGMAAGTAKRFGRSYQPENYQEAVSDALVDAAFKLLDNESFMAALAGHGATTSTTRVPAEEPAKK